MICSNTKNDDVILWGAGTYIVMKETIMWTKLHGIVGYQPTMAALKIIFNMLGVIADKLSRKMKMQVIYIVCPIARLCGYNVTSEK